LDRNDSIDAHFVQVKLTPCGVFTSLHGHHLIIVYSLEGCICIVRDIKELMQ